MKFLISRKCNLVLNPDNNYLTDDQEKMDIADKFQTIWDNIPEITPTIYIMVLQYDKQGGTK